MKDNKYNIYFGESTILCHINIPSVHKVSCSLTKVFTLYANRVRAMECFGMLTDVSMINSVKMSGVVREDSGGGRGSDTPAEVYGK